MTLQSTTTDQTQSFDGKCSTKDNQTSFIHKSSSESTVALYTSLG